MSRELMACKRCGEEVGEGEEDRGRCPHCHGELDPIGECDDDGPFQAGDMVTWESQAQGVSKKKAGEIVAVVPAGRLPINFCQNLPPCNLQFDGNARSHKSYLVEVPSKSGKGKPKLYHPPVSKLRRWEAQSRPVRPAPRTFESFPEDKICPVCGTNDDGPTVLPCIDGTQKGYICEGQPVHLACCIPTNFNQEAGVLYRRTKG